MGEQFPYPQLEDLLQRAANNARDMVQAIEATKHKGKGKFVADHSMDHGPPVGRVKETHRATLHADARRPNLQTKHGKVFQITEQSRTITDSTFCHAIKQQITTKI